MAGGLWRSRKTVVPEFVNLISRRENVFEIPLNGVGADGSWSDFIMGGVGGCGTLRNVVIALSMDPSLNYIMHCMLISLRKPVKRIPSWRPNYPQWMVSWRMGSTLLGYAHFGYRHP
jgi:hypothetical protein